MDVYLLTPDEGFAWLDLADDRGQGEGLALGRPLGGSYRPMRVEPLVLREVRGRRLSDFPLLNHPILVMGRRAAHALGELLDGDVELLPLESSAGEFVAVNVVRVADALELERSVVKRFRSGGIMRVIEYALRREAIEPAAIFRLDEPRVDIYVTDAFRAAVESAGLEGLAWDRLVWSDDPERAGAADDRLDLHV